LFSARRDAQLVPQYLSSAEAIEVPVSLLSAEAV
jgi:hypothetical protein